MDPHFDLESGPKAEIPDRMVEGNLDAGPLRLTCVGRGTGFDTSRRLDLGQLEVIAPFHADDAEDGQRLRDAPGLDASLAGDDQGLDGGVADGRRDDDLATQGHPLDA